MNEEPQDLPRAEVDHAGGTAVWLPVLQDRMLVPFLGWNVTHEWDRSILEFGDDAWTVFDASRDQSIVIRTWARTSNPDTVLSFLTPAPGELAPNLIVQRWHELADGIAFTGRLPHHGSEVLPFPGVCAHIDDALGSIARMMNHVLEVCEAYS